MRRTPRGLRLHIGIFGRRNVGKSSLLNAMTRQAVSIVSPRAGTTTDPVEKPMELLPLGPVLFIDTAGIDDGGTLGSLRVQRSRRAIDRTDLGIVVSDSGNVGAFEEGLIADLRSRGVPTIVVFNKADISAPTQSQIALLEERGLQVVVTVATVGQGLEALRCALLEAMPDDFVNQPAIVADLVGAGGCALLVVPIDKEAPKGRLILPQVQTIRDLLDGACFCLVVRESELRQALACLRQPPQLVVTDSQAFLQVSKVITPDVPLTSFSILFARYRGDLPTQVEGTLAIDTLKEGDHVLVAESCTHHPIVEDIGTVKIPRWLNRRIGGPLRFTHVHGHDFPEDLAPFDLVVHCGGCMHNRRLLLSRILRCREQGVPITNYGLCIAHSLGILNRALAPFEEVREFCHAGRGEE